MLSATPFAVAFSRRERERERSPQINKIVFVIFLPSLLKRKEIQALQMHISDLFLLLPSNTHSLSSLLIVSTNFVYIHTSIYSVYVYLSTL